MTQFIASNSETVKKAQNWGDDTQKDVKRWGEDTKDEAKNDAGEASKKTQRGFEDAGR